MKPITGWGIVPLFLALTASTVSAQMACQPMVGNVGLRDARIWIQTQAPCDAGIVCWADSMGNAPTAVHIADPKPLTRASANTAIFDLGGLVGRANGVIDPPSHAIHVWINRKAYYT